MRKYSRSLRTYRWNVSMQHHTIQYGIVFNITQLWASRFWKRSKMSERWNKLLVYEWLPYVLIKFGEVGSTHPWGPFVFTCPTPKIARRKRAKWSITQRWIIRFRSNLVQSLNVWQPKCCKSSRSRGQRSRSLRDITYQHQKLYNSGTDKLSKVKLGENYPRAERNA